MRIIIEHDDKAPVVFEDVVEYSLCGMHGKVAQADFYSYSGTERLVGLVYRELKRLERINDTIKEP